MRRISILIAVCGLLIAACGDETSSPEADGQNAPAAAADEVTVEAADSDLGQILVDGDGNTLYMFVPDQEADGEPTCYDDCAEAWPAFEAAGDPTAATGADQALVGTAERTDGTTQVTYNDLPLYYFSGDEAAGDTNGQGLNDVWWVMSPEGEPIKDAGKGKKEEESGLSRDDY